MSEDDHKAFHLEWNWEVFSRHAKASLLHRGQVSENHIHSVNWVGTDWLVQLQRFWHAATCQDLVQHVPADQRHEPYGHLEWTIFATLTWQGDVQVHL